MDNRKSFYYPWYYGEFENSQYNKKNITRWREYHLFIEVICPKIWVTPLPKNAKSPLLVDVCRSKTFLLKLAPPPLFTLEAWFSLDLLQVDLLASGASLVWSRSGRPRATKSREVVVPRHMKSDEGLLESLGFH